MRFGLIGLGRMGNGIARRAIAGGHQVVGYDPGLEARATAAAAGVIESASLSTLVDQLQRPRVVWVMVPAGAVTDGVIDELSPLLQSGDTIIDGGNTLYHESIERSATLAASGIHFVDAGTSGGIHGEREGFSLMIGGSADAVGPLEPLFRTLAPAADRGWGHVGPSGAGHFVKMIHNGIEYGMMQAFAEGLAILRAKKELDLDLAQITSIWQHGSVVRSWLLDLAHEALRTSPDLEGMDRAVADSGEGRWTVAEAIALDVAAPVITHSLIARLRSRDSDAFGDRMLSALRKQFGGHGDGR
jgi:6-phosphogluconate dehydrogenase